jgi:ribosomal protein L7Ae-like RNA K-turn-binding protein
MSNLKHYILFPSYNSGLLLESKLKKEKIKYTIVPSPRQLTACCGIAITYDKEDENRIKEIIKVNSIEVKGFYSLETKYKNYYSND